MIRHWGRSVAEAAPGFPPGGFLTQVFSSRWFESAIGDAGRGVLEGILNVRLLISEG